MEGVYQNEEHYQHLEKTTGTESWNLLLPCEASFLVAPSSVQGDPALDSSGCNSIGKGISQIIFSEKCMLRAQSWNMQNTV